MISRLLAPATLLALAFLTVPAWGQRGGQAGDPINPDGGAGGTNNGPGDTVGPGGGGANSGGNGTPSTPVFPTPTPAPTPPPGPTYAPGANPLTPRIPAGELPGSITATPPPAKPSSPPRTDTLNSWQTWWHYNRWAHLEVGTKLVDTGASGFFLGQGEKAQTSSTRRATLNQIREQVQPAIVKAMGRGGQADFVIFTLHALAKIRGIPLPEGQPGFHELVPTFLKSPNQSVSEKCILALGIRGEDRYLPWLVAIIGDTPEGRDLVGRTLVGDRMRAYAAYALGLLGERSQDPAIRVQAYDALMAALPVEREEVQAACLLALGLVPMPSGEDFVEGGDLFRGKTRVDQALAILSFFEDETQSYLARSQAPNALARLLPGAPESLRARVAYPLLVASGSMSDEQREVQMAAVIALGKIGRSGTESLDQEIRSHLERTAFKSGGDRSTRYLAMIALAEASARWGDGEEPYAGLEPTRKTLRRYLARSRGETLAWTSLALGVLEEDALSRGDVPSPESAKAIRAALEKARSSEVAGALAVALGMLRDPEAVEVLRARLDEAGDATLRAYSALALGMIGAPGAVAPIRKVLADSTSQSFVIENAAISLALLGDQETGTRLFDILDHAVSPKVQASVASAMGWIRDPRPLGDLCAMLGDTRRNDTARAWTAVALGRICDEDRWPWSGRLSVDVLYDINLPTLLEPIYETGLLDLP
jgi:HEAT repeat protein